jgi:hypothetical protein
MPEVAPVTTQTLPCIRLAECAMSAVPSRGFVPDEWADISGPKDSPEVP